jgi:hypothetical protein
VVVVHLLTEKEIKIDYFIDCGPAMTA